MVFMVLLKILVFLRSVINAQKITKIYVLGPDLKARGLDKSSLISNIEIIDYKGFVNLTVENEKIQNWL